MERSEAITKLKELEGVNLHDLAREFEVTVRSPNGKVNKGWAGHSIERFLGLPINSAQSPNFGSWELKVVPIKFLKNGNLQFKETMAITMIDPYNVANTTFENSHLLSKLRKAVCVARTVGANLMLPSHVLSINTIDLDGEIYDEVRADYEFVRSKLLENNNDLRCLSGKMGKYVQPRTKGKGHGSISRAFYARPKFLAQFIGLNNDE